MAIKIRDKFFTKGSRSPHTLATVVAMLAWKLAVESIKRMRKAYYDIDLGKPYFDFVCEFMVFLALAADRMAYRGLDAEKRQAFTTSLAIRLSEIVEENSDMLLGAAEPGACQKHFIELFNRRGADYAEFDYGLEQDGGGPSFGFKRMFAAALREILPEKDQLWVIDQAMDIEAPDAIKALDKTLTGLFAGDIAAPNKDADAGLSSKMGGE